MSIFNSFLKQLGTSDSIRDFSHASKLYIANNYRLMPKNGYLFYAYFNFADPSYANDPQNPFGKLELGMLMKSVSLPKYSIDAKVLNSYNRPNIVQTKIHYDPVTMKFHDDSADVVRNFWINYFAYFYRDADHQSATYTAPHKYVDQDVKDTGPTGSSLWGFGPASNSAINFLTSIDIFILHQKRFSQYKLINPVIKSFRHGEHNQQGYTETMEHEMTVEYEAVKYYSGNTSKNTVTGFADMHYDTTPSPLTPAGGGTNSILGPGGILQTASEVVDDLSAGNIGSAIWKTYKSASANKGASISGMAVAELAQLGKNILSGSNPLSKVAIPNVGDIVSGPSAALGGLASGVGSAVGSAITQVSNETGISGPNGANPASLASLSCGITQSTGVSSAVNQAISLPGVATSNQSDVASTAANQVSSFSNLIPPSADPFQGTATG